MQIKKLLRFRMLPFLWSTKLESNLIDAHYRRCSYASISSSFSEPGSATSPADLFPHSVSAQNSIKTEKEGSKVYGQRINENVQTFLKSTAHFNWKHSPGNSMKHCFDLLAQTVEPKHVSEFYEAFPSLVEDLQNSELCQRLAFVGERLEEVVRYNSPPWTQFSSLNLLASHKHFSSISKTKKADLERKEELKLAYILGWCTDLIEKAYNVQDDIVDNSGMRYGRPCWSLVSGDGAVGSMNDVFLLERATFDLIRLYFQNQPLMCAKLVNLFSHAIQSSTYGKSTEQSMENIFKQSGNLPSLEEYIIMSGVQNGSYVMHLPIAAAAILHGEINPKTMKALECVSFATIAHSIMERDFMDVYLDVGQMGNDGTDITNGSMSWLIITAMKHGNARQKQILQENYGKNVTGNVEQVKDIYEQIQIPRRFKEWEAKYYDKCSEMIQQLPGELPKEYIQLILNVSRSQLSKLI